MTVIRIGGFLQPAWARTALALAGTTAAVADRLQPTFSRAAAISHEAARLVAALLTPACLVASAMAVWRLGADLGWTGTFAISTGLFSHWQVWIVLALGLKMTGGLMNREPEKGLAEVGDDAR